MLKNVQINLIQIFKPLFGSLLIYSVKKVNLIQI